MSFITPFLSTLQQNPHASAEIFGSHEYPNISGHTFFFQTKCGVLVAAEISGLPKPAERCADPVFAFHIHSGNQCCGNEDDPFANALTHYNPGNYPHPDHAGDLPPLFGNQGYAFQIFLTNRFSVRDIVGKTIVIHSAPDDFTSQPAGNSGQKIACGQIQARCRC